MRACAAETAGICSIEASVGGTRCWLAVPVLLAGAFLLVLDFNVVNLALPVIAQDLGATLSNVPFVISAYAATPLYSSSPADTSAIGSVASECSCWVAGFTLESVLCGADWSPSILVTGRPARSHDDRDGAAGSRFDPVTFPRPSKGRRLGSMARLSALQISAAGAGRGAGVIGALRSAATCHCLRSPACFRFGSLANLNCIKQFRPF
jgi:MFS family permease